MRVLIAAIVLGSFFVLALQIAGPWQIHLSNGSVAVLALPWQRASPAPVNPPDISPGAVGVADQPIAMPVPEEVKPQAAAGVAIKCRGADGGISYVQGACPSGAVFVKSVSGSDMNVAESANWKQEKALRDQYSQQEGAQSTPVPVLVASHEDRGVPAECFELSVQKKSDEAQGRVQSSNWLKKDHTRVVNRMMHLNCPVNLY